MKVAVRDEKDLIHNAIEALDSGRKWIKHHPKAGEKFCLAGSLAEAAGHYSQEYAGGSYAESKKLINQASERIRESIKKLYHQGPFGITSFNDHSATRWEDVETVLKDAMK